MIHPDALASLRADATIKAWKLDTQQRNALAALALAVANARNILGPGYSARSLEVLYDLAPTLATELLRLLEFADDLAAAGQAEVG